MKVTKLEIYENEEELNRNLNYFQQRKCQQVSKAIREYN